ncbi:glycosyltransferase family 1 protein [Falsarthrobacter nasiphocae]|uniref:Glycosyltransferase involved in cell wall biosynthesis n=1 Tax=Falsarthrobacter nasiphocae TaxID=189863 RepID=A0AAE3YGW4_9MICC|nr:glycosyltransferase family 1 protein [Falsarthrobacter nasiphocae]MDR6892995.1 glycosyltransferase involved in cell wall biosynthesis [Falsarthrobacter nasiphocae]
MSKAPEQRLRIGFDARYTRLERHDGISRFGANLAAAASRLADVTLIVSDPRQLDMLPDLPHVLATPPTSWREPATMHSLRDLEVDVVFSPMQTIGSFFKRHPLVLTIHDLIYYEHRTPPRNLPAAVRALWRVYHLSYAPQRWLLGRADAVAAVSHDTAERIRRHRLAAAPVVVVSNAAEALPAPDPAFRLTPAQQGGDFVYMGSAMPYKGVETLIDAVSRVDSARLHLVSRFDPRTRRRLKSLASRLGADVVFHDGLSDSAYRALLEASTGLVTASRAEGFGLSLVEAMSVGVPIAVSDIPIFREVAGEAAVYFDPTDPAAVAAGLVRLRTEGEDLARLARPQAARFSWDTSAAALVEACRLAIERAGTRSGR